MPRPFRLARPDKASGPRLVAHGEETGDVLVDDDDGDGLSFRIERCDLGVLRGGKRRAFRCGLGRAQEDALPDDDAFDAFAGDRLGLARGRRLDPVRFRAPQDR